ncbi:hypothetical protein LTR56_000754 [Elasticomyces elasticus]|nr:hypothetical protein LTR22_009090 [Elasticomyces elasticus]KAK3660378.1 hypothetical protein LTR56_000754 [Elasticomyces elasticus]KAK4929231.1 hypothetical protein LTR49_004128 [Elasticomyces elasticus]KAK5765787.1 hypothetical protein LTS12_004047 [Elasticomyces elasticus]
MASAIKAKIQKATGGDGGDTADEEEIEKYKLLVTAGPSYDQSQHETIKVNSNECVYVENEFLRAKVNVRCKGFKGRGLPSASPASTPYFDDPVHEKDQYSIGISFVPKVNIPSLDTVWGNDFDHPVRNKLPPGFNTAFKIVKEFIDPGLSCDAYADEPWLYGPSLSCWFAFRIGDKIEQGADFPGPDDHNAMKEGGDGSGQAIRSRLGIPENGDKRRKYFLDNKHRENFTFESGRLYESDFYNPYIDFPNFSLKLPGFSLKIIKYIDQQSHCLRYVFKNRSTGDMYLNVNFRLLWGEQLQKALKKDGEQKQIDSQPSAVAQQATAGAILPDEHPRPAMQPSHSSLSGQPLVGPETAGEQDARIRTSNGVPLTMQLHPGDQGAAGEYNSGPEVIARMLKETSTNDISGTNMRVLGSNVD